jgi:hypothetical protein
MHNNIHIVIVHFFVSFVFMKGLINYINQNFGLSAKARPAGKDEIAHIPLYLKANFDIFKGQIEGRDLLWAKVKEEGDGTPDWLQKQREQLKKIFRMPVVFVFDRLEGWQRKRLIERKIGFVQLNKQLYLPEMLIQLSDVLSRGMLVDMPKKTLSFPAQVALLYHLQKEHIQSFAFSSFQQVARTLHYSPMTVTRLVRELQALELVMEIPKSKPKTLSFGFGIKKKALWDSAYEYLSSPVKEVWFCEKNISNLGVLKAGDTALEEYTMLAEGSKKTYAIGKKRFRSLQKSAGLPELNKKYGKYKLEVWEYDPFLIVDNSTTVDKLSLYLSLQGRNEDERVDAALNELINGVKWYEV